MSLFGPAQGISAKLERDSCRFRFNSTDDRIDSHGFATIDGGNICASLKVTKASRRRLAAPPAKKGRASQAAKLKNTVHKLKRFSPNNENHNGNNNERHNDNNNENHNGNNNENHNDNNNENHNGNNTDNHNDNNIQNNYKLSI